MRDSTPIAVTSRSFSRHPVLRAELLQRYENVTFNEDGKALAGETLVAFLGGHAKAITALEVIDDTLLAQVPELRVISKVAVGLDMIDLDALGRRGVRLAWTPGTNRRSVSELVIALAVALLRHVVPSVLEVRGGMWRQQQGRTLSGRTVGVLGLGHVGQDLVHLLGPFECRVLAQDIREWPEFEAEHRVARVDLETLLRESDVVSVHLPLTEETRNILSAERLARMKMGAILINIARGNLVDERALAALLRSGRLAGAGFEVFAMEPPGRRGPPGAPQFSGHAAYRGKHGGSDPRDGARSHRGAGRRGAGPFASRALTTTIKATPPAAGVGEVSLPGEPERRTRMRRLDEGISVPDRKWQAIVDAAHGVGVVP